MRSEPDEIEQALVLLGVTVGERLAAYGWVGRDLDDDWSLATFTRTNQNGVMVAADIAQTSLRWPLRWPVGIVARVGVGYEPALNLMPLLTMEAGPILVEEHADGGAISLPVSLAGPGDITPGADDIAHWVQEHAQALDARFPEPAAIDSELERRPFSAKASYRGGRRNTRDKAIQQRLVLLAAMGRHDQTRALLSAYEAGALGRSTDGRTGPPDRRFIRQLRRWLDRGCPQAPPVEETLAVLPPLAREKWPSPAVFMETARATTRLKKDALGAARAHARGRNLEELKTLVAAEHSARGIELEPLAVAMDAEMLQLEQRRFGRARATLKKLRMLAALSGSVIRLVKGSSPTDPDWLRPPDRASYPIRSGRGLYVAVNLDPSAREWVDRAHEHARRRVGPWRLIDVWLTREHPTGALVVHIGQRRVGTIAPHDSGHFDHVMTAAAVFDEDPVIGARLAAADNLDTTATVDVPLPRPPRRPKADSPKRTEQT